MARRKRDTKQGKTLTDLLGLFPALKAAWLLDTDGFPVAGNPPQGTDADTVCALCASALATVERMARETAQGAATAMVLGVPPGAVVLQNIDADTWLAVAVDRRERLGLAQLAVRYAQPLLANPGA